MTAKETLESILNAATPEQIDSREFWLSQIERHLSTTDARDLVNQKIMDGLLQLYYSVMVLEEFEPMFTPGQVKILFLEHLGISNDIFKIKVSVVPKT